MRKLFFTAGWIQFLCALAAAGSYDPYSILDKKKQTVPAAFQIWAPEFSGGQIPREHTCDGVDSSPLLEWSEPPLRTQSYALICDEVDPNGKVASRWVIYRIPAKLRKLNRGIPQQITLGDGTKQGINDLGKTGYTGPCPPAGKRKYIFTIFALDTPFIGTTPTLTKAQLFKSMRNHVLEQAHMVGEYQR